MRLRVAVVGAGFIGQLHARVISESPLAKLAAIVDVDQDARETAASRFGVDSYPSVDSICEDPEVDATIIAVPDIAHEEPATRLLQAGKAVLLEKPMAHSLDAARRIAEVARSSQSRLMVGHILRFDPRYAGAASQVAAGGLGQPRQVTPGPFPLRAVVALVGGQRRPLISLRVHYPAAHQWGTGRKSTPAYAP